MHDTHCHVDQDHKPAALVAELESRKLTTIAVTNLPSHYVAALPHVRHCRYVRLALGLHPLAPSKHRDELPAFERLVRAADFVGEVGLDFSREVRQTRAIQVSSFERGLASLRSRSRFITIHSRGAEREVIAMLTQARVTPAVFHWFTGPLEAAEQALADGHFFSINAAMASSQRGRDLVRLLPHDRMLLESDYPHVRKGGAVAGPLHVEHTAKAIGGIRVGRDERADIFDRNLELLFGRLNLKVG